MSRYEEGEGPAKVGETWIVEKQDGTTIRLTLGVHKGEHEWFYPRTNEVYEKQNLVGLVRKTYS